MSSHWRYRGRCIGMVLHFLYHYCGFNVAEYATVGDGKVELYSEQFATFAWSTRFGLSDVPEFRFLTDADGHYARTQATKSQQAIDDGCELEAPPVSERKAVDSDLVEAMRFNQWRSAKLYASWAHNAEPSFFVHKKRLHFEAGSNIYQLNRDIDDWLLWHRATQKEEQ